MSGILNLIMNITNKIQQLSDNIINHNMTQQDKNYIIHLIINHTYEQQADESYYESEKMYVRELLTRFKNVEVYD